MSQSLYTTLKELEKSKEEYEAEIKALRKQIQELLNQIDYCAQGTTRGVQSINQNLIYDNHQDMGKTNSNKVIINNLYSGDLDLNYDYEYTSGDKNLLQVMEETKNVKEENKDKYFSIRGKTDLRTEYTSSKKKVNKAEEEGVDIQDNMHSFIKKSYE